MRSRTFVLSVTAFVFVLCSVVSAQDVRWVHRFNGPGDSLDYAADIAVDRDGNVYVAGASVGDTTSKDFVVLSISPGDSLRWVYRYNQQGRSQDIARSVVVGEDGNIYAAGTTGNWPYMDLLAVSLSPEGEERWTRLHAGPGGGTDTANAITMGPDGNLYIAAFGDEIMGDNTEFVVLSLEPDSGAERWVYAYSASYVDEATSVVCAPDSSVYAAGYFWGNDAYMGVVKLDPEDGAEVWRVSHNRRNARAVDIAVGNDAVYAAGWAENNNHDYTILSCSQDTGGINWAYIKTIGSEQSDKAYAVTVGTDGNVYSAGRVIDTVLPYHHIAVACVNPAGEEQWVYMRPGTMGRQELATDILYSSRNRIYACGWTDRSSPFDGDDIVVVQLDSAGNEVWDYVYDWNGNPDAGQAIVEGPGGEIYVAGTSATDRYNADIVVICLEPPAGVAEDHGPAVRLPQAVPSVVRGRLLLPDADRAELLDISGRRVLDLGQGQNDLSRIAPGVYFVRSADGGGRTVSRVVVQR
ncbi:MAG: SBBP repeat-containing protein [candidate division WOR-3 bacterium]|nr:MAG: SBBP repeat-containing protein [candidate division WOR-3 bacterium]